MSEQLRHKMIDFEATPPPAAWETIASRLEDDGKHAALATKMKNFETPAPAASWKVIAARIEDDAQHAALVNKMNKYGVAPPAAAWSNIAASLHPAEEKQIIPVIPRRTIFYRLAAAAVILFAITGAWMILGKRASVEKTIAKNKPAVPANTVVVKGDKPIPANSNVAAKTNVIVEAEQPNQHTPKSTYVAYANAGSNHDLKYAIVNDIPAFQSGPIQIKSSPILDANGVVIRDMDVLTTSNYLVVMGPNGQTTRISSKFASVIRYLNGTDDSNGTEEYIDRVIKESDTWKKRFQEWRNKISQSSFIPSSANFLDIIEFKELIQEKQ